MFYMVAGVLFWWLGIAIYIVLTTSIIIKQTFLISYEPGCSKKKLNIILRFSYYILTLIYRYYFYHLFYLIASIITKWLFINILPFPNPRISIYTRVNGVEILRLTENNFSD